MVAVTQGSSNRDDDADMSLRVVGAGLGRTGTLSQKMALERLLGGTSYHMMEVFGHPEHIPAWKAAALGEPVDWDVLMTGYLAAVDWPACAFWQPLAAANPDAVILLSTRDSAETWWRSASNTILHGMDDPAAEPVPGWRDMWDTLVGTTFTADILDADAAKAAYEKHNAAVRAEADPSRLVEWQPGDGWEPLCTALGVPVPDEPFPHLNTSEEWLARREPPS
jgi:hypothetical protein